MPRLTIDGKAVEVSHGTLLIDAAAQVGIEIPALCHVQGVRPLTACMLCIIEDTNSGRTLPSCSTMVEEGMVVETNNTAVRAARKEVLQLLLSEHVGDCEAPCRRICPASLNVPAMMRKVAAGDPDGAAQLAREALILPVTLGYVCTAPCERGCRRSVYDEALLIRDMHRRLAEEALSQASAEALAPAAATGKRVAIVGAGLSGLAAAWTLRRFGHACTVFEKADRPGGAVRALGEDELPHAVFDAEVASILGLGVDLRTHCEIGVAVPLADLIAQYDAVILACTGLNEDGNAVFRAKDSPVAVKSVGRGKQVAAQVDAFLRGLSEMPPPEPFDSRLGRIREDEKTSFAAHRMQPGTLNHGRHTESMEREAQRCLHCDCLKRISCALRRYASEYGARPSAYRETDRPRIETAHRNDTVVYEPGKCVRCGLCVEITERAGEPLGLGFVERGFDVRVRVPFGESLEEGLRICGRACAKACPTGALALCNEEEDS